jgi:hypothetical protein
LKIAEVTAANIAFVGGDATDIVGFGLDDGEGVIARVLQQVIGALFRATLYFAASNDNAPIGKGLLLYHIVWIFIPIGLFQLWYNERPAGTSLIQRRAPSRHAGSTFLKRIINEGVLHLFFLSHRESEI